MLKLEKLRFINVGHPDCRMDDLTISALDDQGQPVDTVLWLRNGGGKTVLLGLFFAHLMPDARHFLQGRKENAKFIDHIQEGDTSYVVASWVGEPRTLDLGEGFGDGRPRLVTGRVVERKAGAPPSGTLPGIFFSFRPLPGVLDIDTLPWRAEGRLSLAAFEAEMQRLNRQHPEVDLSTVQTQAQWEARLRDLGLDPQVFQYQRQMNSGEGEAASGFMRFKTSDEFVDFVLGVVTPSARLASLEQEIRRFGEKLRRLPEFKLELSLIELASPMLGKHAEHLRTNESLDSARANLVLEAAAFRDALIAAVDEATGRANQARQELTTLEQAGTDVRQRREELQGQLSEVHYRIACFAESEAHTAFETARANHLESQTVTEAWRLTELLAQQRRLLSRRKAQQELLESRRRDASPQLADVKVAGAALRWRLSEAATALETAGAEADDHAEQRRQESDRLGSEIEGLLVAAAEKRQRMQAAVDSVRELDRARKTLRADNRLRTDESASEGATRWRESERVARLRLAAVRDGQEDLEREAEGLHQDALRWTTQKTECEADANRLAERVREIEVARDRLLASEALRAVVEVESPDLWAEAEPITRALRARWVELADQIIGARLRAVTDTRLRDGVESRGVLPPSPDVEEGLKLLREAGVNSAYLGWDFLRQADDSEKAALMLLRAPELAAGIILNDPDELPRAREALAASGESPTTVVAIGVAEGLDRDVGNRDSYLWPPHPGLYDPTVAVAERDRALSRLQAGDGHLANLQTASEATAEAREGLRQILDHYSPGELELTLEAITRRHLESAALEARLVGAATRRADISQEIQRLAQERAELDQNLTKIPSFVQTLDELAVREESETGWRRLVADGPGEIAEFECKRLNHASRQTTLLGERDGLRDTAAQHRAGGEEFLREAAALPESDFPLGLRQESVEHLRERHRVVSAALRERLGEEAINADLERIDSDLGLHAPSIGRADANVRERAEVLLASPQGQSESSRRAAVESATSAETVAIKASAVAEKMLEDRTAATAAAAETRGQAPRESMNIPSAEVAIRVRQRLTENSREAEREENTINAQRGVLGPRHDQARQRAASLASARRLVEVGGDELPEARAKPEAFGGTPEEAEARAYDLTASFKRIAGELQATRSRATASATELRQLGEQELYRPLGSAISLRLGEPGDRAEMVEELAGELDRRLPGLRADIDSAETDRKMVLASLIQAAKESFRDLRQIQEASKLPDGLEVWSGIPFVQIGFDAPRSEEEWEVRLGAVLEDWVNRQEMPANSGITILRQAVRRANVRGAGQAAEESAGASRSVFRVTLLKPDAILTTQRYPVEAMKFSEGQDLTTAILLYCTFVNLRVRRGGDPSGGAGALVLDNPIGKASLDKLIELQRKVAAIMKVQIIATTGVKDREAISHYPKIVGIRPVRTRDGRMKYLRESPDPMDLGGMKAAELIVKKLD